MDSTKTSSKPQRLGRGLSSLLRQAPVAVPVEVPAAPEGPGADDTAPPGRLNESQVTSASAVPGAPGARAASGARAETGAGAHAAGEEASGGVARLAVGAIRPGAHQPRHEMDERALEGLAASIKTSGLMQPIVVRPIRAKSIAAGAGAAGAGSGGGGATHELIAGERRWRAAQRAGLTHVPSIVVDVDDRTAAEWALVENLQREDLNPVDSGRGLKRLAEEFGATQAEIASRTGLDRSTVANLMRLTELEPKILDLLADKRLSFGHGRALLMLHPGRGREITAQQCAERGWSVRKLEKMARAPLEAAERWKSGEAMKETPAARAEAATRDLERRLSEHMGTRAVLKTDKTGKRGRITLEFYDLDHLDGLLGKMGVGGE